MPVLALALGPVLEPVPALVVGMRGVGGLVLSHMQHYFAFVKSLPGLRSWVIALPLHLVRAKAPETCLANSRP